MRSLLKPMKPTRPCLPLTRRKAKTALTTYASCVLSPDDIIEVRCLRNGQKPQQIWCKARELPLYSAKLAKLNTDGWQIYVGANPRKLHGASGDKNVICARTIFADVDHTDAEVVRTSLKKKRLPPPTLMVSSGHGVHCYWRLADPIAPGLFRRLQHELADLLGSDSSVKNPERIMRLPGFLNLKDKAKPAPCRIVQVNPARVYERGTLRKIIPRTYQGVELRQWHQAPALPTGEKTLKRARAYLAGIPGAIQGSHGDDRTYKAACALRDFGLSEDEAFALMLHEYNPRCEPPWKRGALRQKVHNAYSYSKGQSGSKVHQRFRIFGASDLLTQSPLEWLVKGLIPKQTAIVIFGPSGDGKSFVTLDLAWSIAAGLDCFGQLPVTQGPVVYVGSEGRTGLARRFHAWVQHRKTNSKTLKDWHWTTDRLDLCDHTAVEAFLSDLSRALGRSRPVLIVFDTLAKCLVGRDESNAKDMGLAVDALRTIRERLDCATLVVHHTGKDNGTERGSSALRADADVMFKCCKQGNKVTLTCDKARDAARLDTLAMELAVISLATGNDSCIVKPHKAEPCKSERVADLILQILSKANETQPQGIRWAELLKRVKPKGINKTSFNRALRHLVSAGKIRKNGKEYQPTSR